MIWIIKFLNDLSREALRFSVFISLASNSINITYLTQICVPTLRINHVLKRPLYCIAMKIIQKENKWKFKKKKEEENSLIILPDIKIINFCSFSSSLCPHIGLFQNCNHWLYIIWMLLVSFNLISMFMVLHNLHNDQAYWLGNVPVSKWAVIEFTIPWILSMRLLPSSITRWVFLCHGLSHYQILPRANPWMKLLGQKIQRPLGLLPPSSAVVWGRRGPAEEAVQVFSA